MMALIDVKLVMDLDHPNTIVESVHACVFLSSTSKDFLTTSIKLANKTKPHNSSLGNVISFNGATRVFAANFVILMCPSRSTFLEYIPAE